MEDIKLDEKLDLSPQKPIRLKGLKIAVACMLGILIGFLLATFISLVVNPGDWQALAVAIYLAIFVLIIGGAASVIIMITSVAGIIISVKKRYAGCDKRTTVYFIVFTACFRGIFFKVSIPCHNMHKPVLAHPRRQLFAVKPTIATLV